jgi:hypothetical protein
MNERIEELMRQAIFTIPDGVDFDIPDEFTDKFAELIVRECSDISNQAEKQCQHPGTMIKQHFGVEE